MIVLDWPSQKLILWEAKFIKRMHNKYVHQRISFNA